MIKAHSVHTKDVREHCERPATKGREEVVGRAPALDTAKEQDADFSVEAGEAAHGGRNRSWSDSQPSKSAVRHRCHFRSKVDLLDFNPLTKGVAGETANLDVFTNLASHLFHQISHRH